MIRDYQLKRPMHDLKTSHINLSVAFPPWLPLPPLEQGGQRKTPGWQRLEQGVHRRQEEPSHPPTDTHPSPADLQHHEHEVLVLEEALEAHDVRVVEALVNGDLRRHLLPLVLLQDQGLGHDLPGEDLLGLHVRDFVAFGEAPFAEEASPRVPPHGARVHQDIGDFFERSRFRVDVRRRVRRLRYACAHFGLNFSSAFLKAKKSN